jgi:hypothetical protein
MTGPDKSPAPRRLTARGAATRARIVEAAADLMRIKGANATTLDRRQWRQQIPAVPAFPRQGSPDP